MWTLATLANALCILADLMQPNYQVLPMSIGAFLLSAFMLRYVLKR
jgi:hypothetical protein